MDDGGGCAGKSRIVPTEAMPVSGERHMRVVPLTACRWMQSDPRPPDNLFLCSGRSSVALVRFNFMYFQFYFSKKTIKG